MTEQIAEPQPDVPSVAQLRELTVRARAIVDRLGSLSDPTGERSAHHIQLRALSADNAWQYVREGVSDPDSNRYVVGLKGVLSTAVPLADAAAGLRAQTEPIEADLNVLARTYQALLTPLFNDNGRGLRPDLAAELAQRLPELADLVQLPAPPA